MAGCAAGKMSRAIIAEKAMSVAQGIAQPPTSSAGPLADTSATKISAGTAIPPTAAASGDTAWRGEASGPPGSVASNTSFAASAKKNTIPTSLAAKCR